MSTKLGFTENEHNQPERILGRKVARELTAEEMADVSGGKEILYPGDSFSGPGLDRDDCIGVP
jgi:hypothetical protein